MLIEVQRTYVDSTDLDPHTFEGLGRDRKDTFLDVLPSVECAVSSLVQFRQTVRSLYIAFMRDEGVIFLLHLGLLPFAFFIVGFEGSRCLQDMGRGRGRISGGLGAFFIRIANGEDVEGGNLIESNGDGCGTVQPDTEIKSSTVAKITSPVVAETFDDGSYLVPRVLYCG
ncbi:hypothetical protein [Roseibium aggregatum]|uniref:Uncharacterized protein n=1 Tax=Roseibium aggregatum TaxID=187304 RepID=A0A0M6XZ45_9HYPH|nr:hypothetical protein [Roseibium aggregatum]CTQ42697.1 hypothetical protein LAL4801_01133 [Roseibium aggregatum]